MVHRLERTFLSTAPATRLQRGCDGAFGKLKPSENVGETFHLVKFLPGCYRELWSLSLLARTQGDSALRQEPEDEYGSWSSLGLGIRGERVCASACLHTALSPH